MPGRPVRIVLTILMDLLIIVAIALTVRMVVVFFGALSSTQWGRVISTLTDVVTLPLGIAAIKTPYGGVFDVNAAVTIGALLLTEWVLSMARARD